MKKIYILLFCLLSTAVTSLAQPGDPPDPTDNPVPITGIEILLTLGAGLGIKKLSDKKKQLNN